MASSSSSSAWPYRSIRLSRSVPVRYDRNALQGYRMVVTVTSAYWMSSSIFVFRRFSAGAGETEPRDEFTNVASPADMEEYPENAPNETGRPFFRLSSADLVLRNLEDANEVWEYIQEEVAALVTGLDRMDDLELQEEVFFGSSSSSSSYSSYSSSSSSSAYVESSSSSSSS